MSDRPTQPSTAKTDVERLRIDLSQLQQDMAATLAVRPLITVVRPIAGSKWRRIEVQAVTAGRAAFRVKQRIMVELRLSDYREQITMAQTLDTVPDCEVGDRIDSYSNGLRLITDDKGRAVVKYEIDSANPEPPYVHAWCLRDEVANVIGG